MGRPAVLKVDIVADAKGVGKGVEDADRSFSRLGGGAKKAGLAVAAGLAVGVAAAGTFAVAAVREASNVQQAYGALESVYGKNAAQVKAWAESAATNVGLSKAAYADLSAVVGSQLQGMGVAQEQAGAKTNDLIKMGADLAATFGGSVADAVGAVGSLLRGEADPIERYGVSIKATDVAARLAAQGNDKLTGAALKTAQAQATLALLTEKTRNAHGAFSRETDTLAHQQQVLGAQFDNVKAVLGAALLPILTRVATYLSSNLGPAFDVVRRAVDVLKIAFGAGGTELNEFDGKLKTVNNAAYHLRAAFDAVVAFVRGTVLPAFRSIATFVVDQLVPAFVAFAGPVLGGLRSALASIQSAVSSNRTQLAAIGGALSTVAGVALKLAPIVGTVLAQSFRTAGAVIGGVIGIIGGVVSAVQAAMDAIRSLQAAASKVGNAVGKINPFGGPPLATGLPQLVGGTDLAPRSAQLVTAAFGDDSGSGSAASYGRATGGLVIVDRRTIDARAYVDAMLLDDGVVARLERAQRDRAVRLGQSTAYGVPA